MARGTSIEILEQKIEKAQNDVVRTKQKYDTATAALKELLDKRESLRSEELLKAFTNSHHSYEDILKYLNGNMDEDE